MESENNVNNVDAQALTQNQPATSSSTIIVANLVSETDLHISGSSIEMQNSDIKARNIRLDGRVNIADSTLYAEESVICESSEILLKNTKIAAEKNIKIAADSISLSGGEFYSADTLQIDARLNLHIEAAAGVISGNGALFTAGSSIIMESNDARQVEEGVRMSHS